MVLLGDKDMEYTVHFRPIWEWAVDLLWHPMIGPHCVFDAQWLLKFDGDSFVQFINEPWTADAFWECQVRITVLDCDILLMLYYHVVSNASRCETISIHLICRQGEIVVIRAREGLSCNRSLSKPSLRHQKRKRVGWGMGSWMAPTGKFRDHFLHVYIEN